MQTRALSDVLSEAQERKNAPGVLTPILSWTPRDGLAWVVRQESGVRVRVKLKDSNGDLLPVETDLCLGYKRPGDDQYQVVTDVRDDIDPFNRLSLEQQRSGDYEESVTINNGGNLATSVRENDELAVLVDSDTQVDWQYSRFLLEESTVEQMSMDSLDRRLQTLYGGN